MSIGLVQGTLGRRVLTPSDFTILGAFAPPTTLSATSACGLTHRYIDGNLRLFTMPLTGSYPGYVYSFSVVADELLETGPFSSSDTPPYGGDYQLWGDIYQNALYSVVEKGSGTPPFEGLADGIYPNGLYWDETDDRMYWFYTSSYNNTTSTADNVVGYSTLDDEAHTGTGVGMWKLVTYANGNNRWANGMVGIPSNYAALFGGRRLGIGFGGSYSILSTQTVSLGPALFAVDPAGFTEATNRDYFNSTVLKLLMYPYGTSMAAGTYRATRHSSLKCLDLRSQGDYNKQTDYWNTCDFPPGGVWIDTGTKHGFLVPALLSVGNVDTTVTEAGKTTFSVASATGLYAGQFIRVLTDYIPNETYPFESGTIASIDGNSVTMTEAFTGTPEVPGEVYAGVWYEGGGGSASGHMTPFYIYDPADLVKVANSELASDEVVPKYFENMVLPHVPSYPLSGGDPNATRMCRVGGATFDSTTNRLYILYRSAYLYATNDRRPLIYVFQVS